MGNKGRIHHLGRHLPGPAMINPDPVFHPSSIHPPPGSFPFDMLLPEVMEQKLVVQHGEMQKIVTENQRLATTHFDLRQDLAAAQQTLQRSQIHMNAVEDEQDKHMRALLDNIAKMEADLQASEPIKVELQQAYAEAEGLVAARQELILKVQQLTQDLQKQHGDVQQIPALMSELEALRQEYQQFRSTYDYEKKLYANHYDSLQVMEKNYISMAREVERLRAELANAPNLEGKNGGTYGSNAGYKENDTSVHHSVGQNDIEDVHRISQVHWPPAGAVAPYGGGAPVPVPVWAGYDTSTGPGGYDSQRNVSFNPSWVVYYDHSIGDYEPHRGVVHETQGGAVGADAEIAPGNSATPLESGQAPDPYGLSQTMISLPYASGQAPKTSGSTETTLPYGS